MKEEYTAEEFLNQKMGNTLFQLIEEPEGSDRNFLKEFEGIAKDYAQMKIEEYKATQYRKQKIVFIGDVGAGDDLSLIEKMKSRGFEIIHRANLKDELKDAALAVEEFGKIANTILTQPKNHKSKKKGRFGNDKKYQ